MKENKEAYSKALEPNAGVSPEADSKLTDEELQAVNGGVYSFLTLKLPKGR